MARRRQPPANPFRYGDIAVDEAFTDREREVADLAADARNGQNVVVFAPRRYGKSSLIRRVTQELLRDGVLVAEVDLMKTPTKERLASKLAASIYENLASPTEKLRERSAQIFGGLRIVPVMTIDPTDASIDFSFAAGRKEEDVDATLERLLELPAEIAHERHRRAVLVMDEFQEVTSIDPHLPALMRSIFQEQPEVAHVYLGSKRHMMQRLFNDRNEPFWRSARHVELGVIPPDVFSAFVQERFRRTRRRIAADVADALVAITHAHPYGTQELAYYLWALVAEGESASAADLERALVNVLRAENAHFQRIWEKAPKSHRLVLIALAQEPGFVLGQAYRSRHELPRNASTAHKALAALVEDELVLKTGDGYLIAEPFLREWILRNEV